MNRRVKPILAIAVLIAGLLVPALALAAGNQMKIRLPKAIPESGYFNYTLTGKFDVKGQKKIDIWSYQADRCGGASLRGEMEHFTPYVVKAKGSFKLKPVVSIGPGQKFKVCDYADYVSKGHRREVASTSATVKGPATTSGTRSSAH